MALYVTNELAFEVPEAYEDQTLHHLDAPMGDEGLLAVLITRTPLPPETAFAEVVEAAVKREGRSLPLHQVLAVNPRLVGGAPGIEVVSAWMHGRRQILGRALHVAHRGTRLTFSTTTVPSHREVGDAYFDRMITTLELVRADDTGVP
jgi:hypothetical protein